MVSYSCAPVMSAASWLSRAPGEMFTTMYRADISPRYVVPRGSTSCRLGWGQDGLAGQPSRGGQVVDGGQVGQRPPFGHVDLQISGVDAGDQLGELSGVAAREDPH